MDRRLAMKTFVPPLYLHNDWVHVVLCRECLAVGAVVEPVGETGWKPIGGAGDAGTPCVACGHFVRPAPRKVQPEEASEHHPHRVRAVARYASSVVWYRPGTWGSVGRWSVSRSDLRRLGGSDLADVVSLEDRGG